ncbi:MAG: glycerol-3-phosphate dehydrogenase/oxidase [Gammaproteobacteria bacterium]|nr:glycerol-3-phosphate dehydrogenase/oxidase [Gammaproteobacteria bacterium]
MNNIKYDLIIVGAGIHGVAVAREAVREGMKVCLIEQFDKPAQGTSSKSSKLIHGGLRYLESLEINLVYECLRDRKRLLDLYPDDVKLVKFYIPVYEDSSRSALVIRAGLTLYATLGGAKSANRFRSIPRSKWSELDGLNSDGLNHVFQYHDAQTDDAKLTRIVLDEAMEKGARVMFNCELTSCYASGPGVKVDYQYNNDTLTLESKYLINAAGPWVNHVLQRCEPTVTPLDIDLVQGSHIELPGILDQGIYYLEAPQDQRAVFAMPWKGHIMVGTTEKMYRGDPAKVAPTQEEVEYLLTVYNHYFANNSNKKVSSDVIASWAGLRVLPRSDENAFNRSRETIFHKNDIDNMRIISIYGGKLTSHYSTARKLLKQIR